MNLKTLNLQQDSQTNMNRNETRAYIAGMIDSKSSILVRIYESEGSQYGYRVDPSMTIMRNVPFSLQVIDNYCMENGIYSQIQERNGNYELVLRRTVDMEKFLQEIQPYIQDRQEEVSVLLEEILPVIMSDQYKKSKEDFVALVEMVDDLRSLNPQIRGTKYTAEYFRDEWNLDY